MTFLMRFIARAPTLNKLTSFALLSVAAIFLLNVMACGEKKTADNLSRNLKSSHTAPPVFVEVTQGAGLSEFKYLNGAFGKFWFPEQMAAGCGFIDYDGDDWLDILLVGGGALAPHTIPDAPALWLYRNNGDGTFSLKTKEAGLQNIRAYGTGVNVADYDNDGDEDIYFTTLKHNMLLRNDPDVSGRGRIFTEVGQQAGVVEPRRWSSSSIFFDGDADGWLDLYVCNYADWSSEKDLTCLVEGGVKDYCPPGMYVGVENAFYHNNGDGTFTDQTTAAGFANSPGKSLGVAELDFNKDGWPDLVVANDGERDLLYENNRNGTFTERGTISGIAYSELGEARAGMGIDAGVTDSTGYVSVFVGNFSQEMVGVYRYTGKGWFADRSAASKIGRATLPMLTFGLFLMDVDFDGDLDLFIANGHVYPVRTKFMNGITYRQPAQLFLSNNDGTFEDGSSKLGGVWGQQMVVRGAAFGDFDRDGDPDILLTENTGGAHLWRNDFQNPNFLRVHLEGKLSNREGLDARLVATVGRQKMERRVRTASSYLSSSEKTVTFGLGAATRVDSLIICWPNRHVEQFAGIEANQEIHVIEGANAFTRRALPGRKTPSNHSAP